MREEFSIKKLKRRRFHQNEYIFTITRISPLELQKLLILFKREFLKIWFNIPEYTMIRILKCILNRVIYFTLSKED